MNPKLRILIVDDDRRMTRTLADILSLSGYEATEAFSAEQAIQLAGAQAFDCVLTDFKMPGKNGVELHQELRKVQPGLPEPVIQRIIRLDDPGFIKLELIFFNTGRDPIGHNLQIELFFIGHRSLVGAINDVQ